MPPLWRKRRQYGRRGSDVGERYTDFRSKAHDSPPVASRPRSCAIADLGDRSSRPLVLRYLNEDRTYIYCRQP